MKAKNTPMGRAGARALKSIANPPAPPPGPVDTGLNLDEDLPNVPTALQLGKRIGVYKDGVIIGFMVNPADVEMLLIMDRIWAHKKKLTGG